MELTPGKKAIIVVLVIIVSSGLGYFAKPSKVEVQYRDKLVYKDREVIKEVIKVVKEVRKNVVTVVKEVKAPDGTVTKETRTEDKTEVTDNRDTNLDKKKESESTKESEHSKVTINDSGLSLQALALSRLNDLNNREYGLLVKKRIISNVSGTILFTHKSTVGLAVGIDF